MTVIWLLWLPVTLAAPKIFPLVDPGLFVISGVKTCGGGGGYCLLGLDCTLDEDFLPDNEAGQHCDGLKSAFTPSAHFVCCRATNKTAYKPPIVFPSVLTTANTEPMTARTTTLNILENEIDQVLQKVAQSVHAVNKSPVTEATLPQVDENDQTSELRESEEADEEEEERGGEEEEEEEEMVADSPIEEIWQEMSPEDDDVDDLSPGILEENKNRKESVQPNKPDNTSPPTMVVLNQSPKTEESSIEKQSEENTISPGDILKGSVAEEHVDKDDESNENNNEEIPQERPMIKDNQLQDNFSKSAQDNSVINVDTSLSDSENLNLPQETKDNTYTVSVPKEATPQDSKDKTTNSPSLEEIPLSSENTLSNDKYGEKSQAVSIASDKEIKEDDLSVHATSIPDISDEVINEAEPSNTDDETQSNTSESSHVLQNQNTVNQENVTSSINEVPNSSGSVLNDENQMETGNVLKESITQLSNGPDVNGTNVLIQSATEPDENQLVTTSPMSPATQPSNNIQPTVMQGQPGTNEPCAKVTGEKCTQEVKFVINNQTLCFGSVYALDWVVTSASCALRIFRAGMLNVIISPLSEMSKGQVKTIVVHESFAENSGASGQGMEANNIGLVQLLTPMVEWSRCVPCLPEAGMEFTGVNCSAVTPQPLAPTPPQLCARPEDCKSARSESPANTCEGPSRKMTDDLGFSYITLNCDILWEPRFYDPSSRGSGAPLYCGGGVLAGLETGAGLGLMVYTPLTPYLPWLLKNTRPGTPEQTFNVG